MHESLAEKYKFVKADVSGLTNQFESFSGATPALSAVTPYIKSIAAQSPMSQDLPNPVHVALWSQNVANISGQVIAAISVSSGVEGIQSVLPRVETVTKDAQELEKKFPNSPARPFIC